MNLRTVFYWVVVALPLSWGVLQSVNTALPLFDAKPMVIPYLTIPVPVAAPAPKPVSSLTPAAPPVVKASDGSISPAPTP